MVDKPSVIAALGLEHFTAEQQDAIFDDYTLELGAAMSDGLNDEQMDEFTRIINGDQPTIDGWLAAHEPNYRETVEYRELEVGYREDPDQIPADKVYASLAWIRTARPDFVQIVERVTREFKQMLAAAADTST